MSFENALLVSDGPDDYRSNGNNNRKHGVFIKHRNVLELYMKGLRREEVAELTGYSTGTISIILRRPDIIALKQQINLEYESDISTLISEFYEVMKEGFRDSDIEVNLKTAALWAKEFGPNIGKKIGKSGPAINISAEDVAILLLNESGQISARIDTTSSRDRGDVPDPK